MVSLMVDSRYLRRCNTLSVNSAEKISKMAMLFPEAKLKVAFSSCVKASILKILRTLAH